MSLVTATVEGEVGVVELARPERHNSLVPELLEDLIGAHGEMAAAGARAGILAAAGPTFSTGGDLKAIREAEDRIGYSRRLVGLLNEAILAIAGGPIPMVAAVHGIVTGGSLGLVLACDHVVMGEGVTVRSWYASVGFAPDGGWTALLPEVIGRHRAAGVLLRDAAISSGEALAWGLADEVVPVGEVGGTARRTAERIASLAAGTRAAIRRLAGPDLERAARRLEAERAAFLERVDTPEATAGLDSFLRSELR